MSRPTEEELAPLAQILEQGKASKYGPDDEEFHIRFDDALEARLKELDPEWMETMAGYYEDTGLSRWCA